MANKPKPAPRAAERAAQEDVRAGRADAPNTAQLRARVPSARTVTTDSAHEPSAAPFDTDDEAAGRPAPGVAVREALRHEGRLPPPQAPGAAARLGLLASIWIALAVAGAVVMAWVVFS